MVRQDITLFHLVTAHLSHLQPGVEPRLKYHQEWHRVLLFICTVGEAGIITSHGLVVGLPDGESIITS